LGRGILSAFGGKLGAKTGKKGKVFSDRWRAGGGVNQYKCAKNIKFHINEKDGGRLVSGGYSLSGVQKGEESFHLHWLKRNLSDSLLKR